MTGGLLDIFETDSANFALRLRHQPIRCQLVEQVGVHPVHRSSFLQDGFDSLVNLIRGPIWIEFGGRAGGQVADAGRIVALVGAADQVFAAAEGADDFSAAGQEGDNSSHGTTPFSFRIRLTWLKRAAKSKAASMSCASKSS